MKILAIFISFIQLIGTDSTAQFKNFSISEDKIRIIQQALDSIYNLKYSGADSLINSLEKEIPEYPGLYLLRAYYYIWKYKPLQEDNPSYADFIRVSDSVLVKSALMLQKKEDDQEAVFYALSIHAMLARLYVDAGYNWKAIKEAQKAYQYLKYGMDYSETFPEFNLYCGIYNYYRVKYPEDNPFVKPILWFFMDGDKDKGLQMLERGGELGLFTRIECLTYLFHIYFRYEFLPAKSIYYSKKLYESYPNNETFTALLIENLIYLNQFDEAEILVARIDSSQQDYYRYASRIYHGLISEKHDNNLVEARNYYLSAIKIGQESTAKTPHYESLCYLGFGRVNLKEGKKQEAKKYLSRAEKISEYGFVRNEASRLLESL